MLHEAFFFARPIFLLCCVTFIVQLFPFTQAKFKLDSAIFVMQIDGDERVAALFDFSDEFADFLGFEEQLSCPGRVG